jgi:transcription elongation factor
MSAVAHYIAGVLARESMVEIVEGLWQSADFKAGDRVKTLRGSTRGVVVRVQPDGRVAWRPDGSQAELVALPESLLRG